MKKQTHTHTKLGQSGFKTIGIRNIHKPQSFENHFFFLKPTWSITITGYISVHKAKCNMFQITSIREIIGNNPEIPFQ